MKVLLNSFHLNGHTLGFHSRTQKFVETSYTTQCSVVFVVQCFRDTPRELRLQNL